MNTNQKKFHYGWVVAVAVFLQYFIIAGLLSTSGMYVLPVTASLGITQAEFFVYLTCMYSTMSVAVIIGPKLFTRFKVVSINRVTLITMAIGGFLMAAAQNKYMLYAGGIIQGASMVFSSFLYGSMLLPKWFKKNISTVVAVTFMGFTLGGAVMNPVISKLVSLPSLFGMEAWRGSYVLFSSFILIVGSAIAWFVTREAPADGIRIGEFEVSDEPAETVTEKHGIPKKFVFKHPSFWIVVIFIFGLNIGTCAMDNYIPAHAILSGIADTVSYDIAGIAPTVLTLAGVIGAFIIGRLNDKMGVAVGAFFGGLTQVIGCALLLLGGKSALMLLLGTAIHGIAFSASNVYTAPFITQMYGERDYDSIAPTVSIFGPVVGGIAAPIYGVLFGMSNNYNSSWMLGAVAGIMMMIGGLAPRIAKGLKSKWE